MSPPVGGWDKPKVNFVHVSTLSWLTLGIFLDFTIGVTVHFYPPYKGGASLSRLLPVAKLCQFFELVLVSLMFNLNRYSASA